MFLPHGRVFCFGLTALATAIVSGCISSPAARQEWSYLCQDGYQFSVVYNRSRDAVRFTDGELDLKLRRMESASGARYTDGSFVFWAKGLTSFIRRDGETLHTGCVGDYDNPADEA